MYPDVYGAFNTSPDFNSGPPSLKSLHSTFEGALSAFGLAPSAIRPTTLLTGDHVTFLDGCAMIKRLQVKEDDNGEA